MREACESALRLDTQPYLQGRIEVHYSADEIVE